MDTPGVMLPNVPDEQTGMRLALTGISVCESCTDTALSCGIANFAYVTARKHAAIVSGVSPAWLTVCAGWNTYTGLLCHLFAGAVKDSIVGEERLVRHLLMELAQQAPQLKGITV